MWKMVKSPGVKFNGKGRFSASTDVNKFCLETKADINSKP